MKRIFKYLIGILLLTLIIKCQEKSKPMHKKGWKTYATDPLEYSVQYPSNWDAFGGNDFFITGRNRGYSTMAWTIHTTSPTDLQTIDSLFKEQYTYGDPYFSKELIHVNGIKGFRYYNIESEAYIGYSECVIIKTNSKWYKLSNMDDLQSGFDYFYKSFQIIKGENK